MSARDVTNALAVASALACAAWLSNPSATERRPAGPRAALPSPAVDIVSTPNGARALVDATGRAVPLRDYRRIVAGSTIARDLLVVLAERERIAAVVDYGLDDDPLAYQLADLPTLPGIADIERLLPLAPDLVLVHGLRDPARVARLREAGLEVFDLGQMRGLQDLLPNIAQVATLLGAPERGRAYANLLRRRLTSIAAATDANTRRSAAYVGIHGGRMYGGTVGSSYHDVLVGAGLHDAAAARYQGWPQYSIEDLLVLDPPVLVTQEGMGQRVCSQPQLHRLRACGNGRRGIIEMPRTLLGAPGPALVDAAALLHERAYPPTAAARDRE